MLDDLSLLGRNKILSALTLVREQCCQLDYKLSVLNKDHDNRVIKNVLFVSSNDAFFAANVIKTCFDSDLLVPLEIIYPYELPNYVNQDSLVIFCDYQGNNLEIQHCLNQAVEKGSQIAIVSSAGRLIEAALANNIAYAPLMVNLWPRTVAFYELKATLSLLINFNIIPKTKFDYLSGLSNWLLKECDAWSGDVLTSDNYAKQIANFAVGKTAIFYGDRFSASLLNRLKGCWHENSKNVAFSSSIFELNHGEALGWLAQPIEKSFAVINIISNSQDEESLKQFDVADRLLSGIRPKAMNVKLKGDSLIKQLLWGSLLMDFVSIYLAALNNVNPMDSQLLNKLDKELSI